MFKSAIDTEFSFFPTGEVEGTWSAGEIHISSATGHEEFSNGLFTLNWHGNGRIQYQYDRTDPSFPFSGKWINTIPKEQCVDKYNDYSEKSLPDFLSYMYSFEDGSLSPETVCGLLKMLSDQHKQGLTYPLMGEIKIEELKNYQEQNNACSICLENVYVEQTIYVCNKCKQYYHEDCGSSWFAISHACPYCKSNEGFCRFNLQ